jgi:hypothetical protein
VRSLLGFRHEPAQVRLRAIAQIVLLNGAVAKIKQPQAKAELAAGRALNHTMPLQHHKKAVRRALMQLQRGGHLRQTQGSFTFAQQIQNRKGPVKGLNLVSALGSCVSHIDPLFRLLSPFLGSQMMRRASTGETPGLGTKCRWS